MIDLSQYEDRYSSISVGQAMGIAWRRMVSILFKPFSLTALLTFGMLGLFSRLGAGSKNLRSFSETELPSIFVAFFRPTVLSILLIIAAAVIAWACWLFVEARLKLIYLSSIGAGNVRFAQFWREHKKTGNSLFRWMLIFYFALVVNVGSLIGYITYIEQYGRSPGGYQIMLIMFSFMGSLTVVMLANFFAMRFILPLMVIKKISFLDAYRLLKKLYAFNKSYMISYFFASLGIYVGVVIGGFMLAYFGSSFIMLLAQFFISRYGLDPFSLMWIISGISFIFLLQIKIIGAIVLQPFQIWYQGWGLAFYSGFGDDFKVLDDEQPIKLDIIENIPAEGSP